MRVTEQTMINAIECLETTSAEHAERRARVEALNNQKKTTLYRIAQRSMEKTAGAQERSAYASFEYESFLKEIEKESTALFVLTNKRDNAKIVIDCWRSLNASTRRPQNGRF